MTSRDWFPIITLVIGSALGAIGGLLSERYRYLLALGQVREERQLKQRLERNIFNRDTLIKLQQTGKELLDATIAAFEETWPSRRTHEGQAVASEKQPIKPETDERRRKARLEAEMLLSLVENSSLCELGRQTIDLSRSVVDIERYDEARKALAGHGRALPSG
jgi:hypothetical protein